MGATASTGGPAAMRAAVSFAPGTIVGEYRIEGQLGEGGMGAVYAAIHPVIAKRAAIKVLHPELSTNREAVERFIQEARSVNEIGHPNIVDVFAFGALPDGRNYFVMEWLRGESLSDRLRRGRVPLAEAIAIVETVTLPLEAAHEHGIVHRDLKPDNVFLVDTKGRAPTVKLLDFGIAKLIGGGTVRRTQTGNLLGTPAYISPEQARGEGVDHRTDIYALGAMVFEMFTGQLVFDATNAADMLVKHLCEPPRSATELNPDVPPRLDALIAAMLAKDPAGRPTLEQIRGELRAALGDLPAGAMSSQRAVQYPIGTPPPQRVTTPLQGVHATPGTYPPRTITAPGGVPLTPVPTIATVVPRRSRAPIIAAVVLAAAGLGVGALVAQRSDPQPAVVLPTNTAPANAAPANATPANTAPANAAPANAAPLNAAPARAAPANAAPAIAAPPSTAPADPAPAAAHTAPANTTQPIAAPPNPTDAVASPGSGGTSAGSASSVSPAKPAPKPPRHRPHAAPPDAAGSNTPSATVRVDENGIPLQR